jgi:hypothetical protein
VDVPDEQVGLGEDWDASECPGCGEILTSYPPGFDEGMSVADHFLASTERRAEKSIAALERDSRIRKLEETIPSEYADNLRQIERIRASLRALKSAVATNGDKP